MKRKIGDLLISLGISPSHFGFNYIIEAVLLWDGKTPTTKIYEKETGTTVKVVTAAEGKYEETLLR